MRTHLRISASIFLILFSTGLFAQDATTAHKDSLNAVIGKYYELNSIIFQPNSTVEDVDRLFDLFTDEFVYVHPKYGGTYTREDLYVGYLRNQKNGAYDGSIADIKIAKKITGLNACAVQKHFIEKKGDVLEQGEPQMTLFEFEKGRISRIMEFW